MRNIVEEEPAYTYQLEVFPRGNVPDGESIRLPLESPGYEGQKSPGPVLEIADDPEVLDDFFRLFHRPNNNIGAPRKVFLMTVTPESSRLQIRVSYNFGSVASF